MGEVRREVNAQTCGFRCAKAWLEINRRVQSARTQGPLPEPSDSGSTAGAGAGGGEPRGSSAQCHPKSWNQSISFWGCSCKGVVFTLTNGTTFPSREEFPRAYPVPPHVKG